MASVTVIAVVIVIATAITSTGRIKGRHVLAPLMPVLAKDSGVPGTPTIMALWLSVYIEDLQLLGRDY
jgi:hypothetical protein